MKLSPCSDPVLDRMDLGKPRKSKENRPVRSGSLSADIPNKKEAC